MGSFSWTKADLYNTQVANIVGGHPFKLLIPAEFGGGYIADAGYDDYGKLTDKKTGKHYDMYELLAYFNRDMKVKDVVFPEYSHKWVLTNADEDATIGSYLTDTTADELPTDDEKYDAKTEHNRLIGIDIGCYDEQVNALKYPLKLVSASYKGTYEDCTGKSYSDPEQGWRAWGWDEYKAS